MSDISDMSDAELEVQHGNYFPIYRCGMETFYLTV